MILSTIASSFHSPFPIAIAQKCFIGEMIGLCYASPAWVSRREQREYIHQVIMTQVKFCDHIDGDGKTKEMSDSIYEISKKTGDYMIDWYKRNHKSE